MRILACIEAVVDNTALSIQCDVPRFMNFNLPLHLPRLFVPGSRKNCIKEADCQAD